MIRRLQTDMNPTNYLPKRTHRTHFRLDVMGAWVTADILQQVSGNSADKGAILLHWCSIENHQSPIYEVNFHFSSHPDGC